VQLDEPLLPSSGALPGGVVTEHLLFHVPGDPVLFHLGMVLVEAEGHIAEPFLS